MSIGLLNKQKTRLDMGRLRAELTKASCLLDLSKREISFVLCDNAFIRRLHKKYFNDKSVTDVISFDLSDGSGDTYLGEVIVSVECARTHAPRYHTTVHEELLLYCIHGLLHLAGFDDRTTQLRRRMELMQRRILEKVLKVSRSPVTSKNR
jgi:probable rRNA maturation factor